MMKVKIKLADGGTVPGVHFSNPVEYKSELRAEPVFLLETKEKFLVYVSKSSEVLTDNFANLQQYAQSIMDRPMRPAMEYDAMEMPMVDMDVSGELPIFEGIDMVGATGQPYRTGKGKFQGILKLNEKGARAKAAAGGMVFASCVRVPKPTYTMDGPFLFWIAHKNVVYFAAHVFPDSMRAPANLD
jgi:hypothetical protein